MNAREILAQVRVTNAEEAYDKIIALGWHNVGRKTMIAVIQEAIDSGRADERRKVLLECAEKCKTEVEYPYSRNPSDVARFLENRFRALAKELEDKK